MKFVHRIAARRVSQLLRTFPAVLVVGPRQCGKSTLVRNAYPEWTHVDLERPRDRERLEGDLEGFFEASLGRVAIDEAQRLPEIFPVLRHVIDRSKRKGRFILTGSASPALMRAVSESLAGRIGVVELTPFSAAELSTAPRSDRWFWGGFPAVHALRGHAAREAWFEAYVATFLERDLPLLGIRLSAQRLRSLWTMLTHVHGQLLNIADLGRSLTVSHHTVADHLDVLEGAFMIRRLPPYFANVQKRLTKAPKLYVRDTGLLHFLAGLRGPADLQHWPRRGHSFEGLVIEELAALVAERTTGATLHFWRTAAGAEVDLLIRDGRRLVPIEIKLGAAVDRYAVVGLRQCMKDLGLKRGYVVAKTRERYPIGADVEVIPWSDVVLRREDFGLGTRGRVR